MVLSRLTSQPPPVLAARVTAHQCRRARRSAYRRARTPSSLGTRQTGPTPEVAHSRPSSCIACRAVASSGAATSRTTRPGADRCCPVMFSMPVTTQPVPDSVRVASETTRTGHPQHCDISFRTRHPRHVRLRRRLTVISLNGRWPRGTCEGPARPHEYRPVRAPTPTIRATRPDRPFDWLYVLIGNQLTGDPTGATIRRKPPELRQERS